MWIRVKPAEKDLEFGRVSLGQAFKRASHPNHLWIKTRNAGSSVSGRAMLADDHQVTVPITSNERVRVHHLYVEHGDPLPQTTPTTGDTSSIIPPPPSNGLHDKIPMSPDSPMTTMPRGWRPGE